MRTTTRSLRPFFLGFVLLAVLTPARAQWWHWFPAGTGTLPRVTSAQNGGSGLTPSLNNYTPGPSVNQPLANDYTTGATLFNFGTTAGDTLYEKNDDGYQRLSWAGTGPEGTSLSLPFFNSRFQHTYLNNNGNLSFNSGVSAYTASPLPIPSLPYPMIAPFFADVDTRAANGGNVWYRTTQSAAELAAIGSKVMSSVADLTNFNPTFAQVVTWDRVGYYPEKIDRVNTFQAVVATDGLQTYTLFLYPNRAIWWDRGLAPGAEGSFAQVGVTDGTAANTLTFVGTGTAAVRDLWFLTNTTAPSPGTLVFDVSGTASDLTVSGTHTLTAASPTVVPALSLTANPAGHFITGTAATVDTVTNVNPSIQFNSLQFADATNRVTFQANTVAIARGASAITHGNLTFTDTSRLVAGTAGALNGGTITLQKDAKLALYAANATTSATNLVFDQSAGSTGGTLDLRGFNTTLGEISSANSTPGAGLITNSGPAAATLTTQFDNASLTFSGTLQDGAASLALVKQGSGTLTLTGTNTYSGGTTISAGTLALSSANALGSTGAISLTGGTLQFSAANTTDYSARFSKAAGQAYRLDTNGQNVTLASALSSSGGSLTKLGSGTLVLSGSNSYTGTTTVSEGTLQIGSGGTAGTLGSGAVINDAVVVFNRTNSLTVSNSISGTGGIAQVGSGTVTLSGNNSYTGGAILAAGTLELGSAGALGSSGHLVFTGGTLRFSAANTTDYSSRFFYVGGQSFRLDTNGQNVSLASALQGSNNPLTKLGAGTLTLAGNNSYSGVTTISAGTLQIGNGGTSGSLGSGSVTNNASLLFNRSDDISVANAISGSGSLTKSGSGTLTLTSANTYSGGTTISAGTLQIGNGSTNGSVSGAIVNHATLAFHRSDATIHGGTISGSGQVVITNPGGASFFLRLSGDNTYSGGTTLTTGSSVLLSHPNGLGSGLVTLQANSILFATSHPVNLAQLATPDSATSAIATTSGGFTHAVSDSGLVNVRLQGPSSLTKTGTGTLTLAGNNSYSGTTTISAGTLQIGSGSTTGTLGSSNVVNNATLLFNRSNPLTIAHEISGTGNVGTTGSGTLTLTGNNSYSGGTTLGAGTLALGSANAVGSSGTLSFNGGTLQFSSANTTDYSARFSNAAGQAYRVDTNAQSITFASALTSSGGTLTKLGAGTLTLTGANTFSGTTTLSAGTLQIGNGGTTGSLSGSIVNDATLAFNRSNALLHGGTISGTGAVIVTNGGGAGKYLHLSGANTYSGGTTLTTGSSVLLGHASGLGSGPVTMQENTILFATSYNVDLTKFTSPSNAASAIVTTSGAFTYDTTASATLGVRLQGFTTGFTKSGSGTLILTGANSYSGATTITGGTLQIGHGGTTGSLGFDAVTNNATLAFNRSNALTLGHIISGTGSVSQLGSGTLTLIGASTYSGGTTVSAGTLKVANTTGSALGSGLVTVASGATLTGPGSFTGSLQLSGTVSPGNSPGTLSAGHTTFASGGTYVWEINNATGTAGTNYDLLSISGTLTLAATSANPFTLSLVSLLPNNAAGNVINFDSTQNYAYTIATTTGGILGFDAAALTINSASFTNALAGGTWSLGLTNSNRDLTLSFTAAAAAIPEPSTYAAMFGAAALALAAYRRRRVA